MTEQEWLTCGVPQAMLNAFASRIGSRKLRLFACACCRRYWHLITNQQSRKAVETAELFADGLASAATMESAERDARAASPHPDAAWYTGEATPWDAACYTVASIPWDGASDTAEHVAWTATRHRGESTTRAARESLATVLRDIFGNPFRPVRIQDGNLYVGSGRSDGSWQVSPADWLTPQVKSLALAAYEQRQEDGSLDPFRLALVADALEEAGCVSEEILAHLRSEGPHYRGMWSLDLILGKE